MTPTAAYPGLTEQDKHRLTVWKWRYVLLAEGFDGETADRLCFARWRVLTGRLNEERNA